MFVESSDERDHRDEFFIDGYKVFGHVLIGSREVVHSPSVFGGGGFQIGNDVDYDFLSPEVISNASMYYC